MPVILCFDIAAAPLRAGDTVVLFAVIFNRQHSVDASRVVTIFYYDI